MPTWALIIIKILEFTGKKIAANKRREREEKKKDATARKKHAAEQAERVTAIKRLQAERIRAEQVEYEREEKSKKVQADLKKQIESMQVPGDYADDY